MKQKKRAPNEVWTPESQHHYTLRRITQADARNQPTLREFAKWLEDSRDLSPDTITDRIRSASTFADSLTSGARCCCAQALRSITVQQIEDFFVEYGKAHGIGCRRKMRAAMRLLLMLAAWRGWADRELADAVPSLGGYRLSGLPRGISDEAASDAALLAVGGRSLSSPGPSCGGPAGDLWGPAPAGISSAACRH